MYFIINVWHLFKSIIKLIAVQYVEGKIIKKKLLMKQLEFLQWNVSLDSKEYIEEVEIELEFIGIWLIVDMLVKANYLTED